MKLFRDRYKMPFSDGTQEAFFDSMEDAEHYREVFGGRIEEVEVDVKAAGLWHIEIINQVGEVRRRYLPEKEARAFIDIAEIIHSDIKVRRIDAVNECL